MSFSDQYNDIERYIRGELSGEALEAFERQLQEDAELAQEVRLNKELEQALKDQDAIAFRRQLTAISSEMATSSGLVKAKRLPEWAFWFATLGAILLIFWLIWPDKPRNAHTPGEEKEKSDTSFQAPAEKIIASKETDKKRSPETNTTEEKRIVKPYEQEYLALAESFYSPYSVSSLRKDQKNELAGSAFELARQAYIDKKWELVIQILDHPEQDLRTESLKLRSHALFQLRQFEKAAEDFKELSDGFSFYKYDAEWNQLLCYLALMPEKTVAFEALLHKILDNADHPFREKALKIQKEVR